MKIIFKHKARGSSTLEILIAFSILCIVLTAAIVVVFGNQSVSVDTETNNEALARARGMNEKVRSNSRQDFNLVYTTPTTTEAVGPLTYSKKLDVSQIGLFVKQATTTVSWQSGGRTLQIVLSTLLSNPQVVGGGDTCSSVLTSGWSHPTILNPSHTIDISPTSLTGVAVSNGKVYLTGTHSSNNKPRLTIVDVSDPTWPKQYPNSLDTGKPGLAAVAVAGNYAYAANKSVAAQLMVIKVADPNNPTLVASKKVTGAGGVGNSIFYANKKIYLGLTANGAGPQFAVFDVATNPENPVPVSGGTYSFGHDINAIRVKNNYAYIATPDSASRENIIILDVNQSSPTFMQRVGGYAALNLPDSNGVGSNYGESLDIVGNMVYLGRSYGTNEFYALDATTPNSVGVIASKDIGAGNGTSIDGVKIRSSLAFMITDSQFQVWQLSDLSTMFGLLDISSFGGSPPGSLACEGNLFYLGDIGPSGGSGHNVLQIIGPGSGL